MSTQRSAAVEIRGRRQRSGAILAALLVPLMIATALSGTAQAAPPTPVRAAAAAVVSTPGSFVAVAPTKAVDTRAGTGTPRAPIPASGVLAITLAGRAGVPTTGASAVTIQITAVNPAAGGWLSAFATGTPRPGVANLNWVAGRSAIATVVVALSAQGGISLFNGAARPLDVVVEVQGYVAAGAVTAAGAYVPVTPARSLDTRTGVGAHRAAWSADNGSGARTLSWQVAGRTGIPATGAVAVLLSVTATNATGPGTLTAFEDQPWNPALEWNWSWTTPIVGMPFEPGIPTTNLLVVNLSAAGRAEVSELGADTVDVMADVVGYIAGGGTVAAGLFQPSPPARVASGRLAAAAVSTLTVDAPGGSSVALTVTSSGGDWGSLYVWEHGTARPAAPQVKLGSGRRSMATVLVRVSAGSTVDVYNGSNAAADFQVDQYGYFRGSAAVPRTVWSWGENEVGQLAHGTTSVGSATPAPVLALTGAAAVAGTDRSGYAITADGSLWAWGKNSNDDDVFQGGQLGDDTSDDRFLPVKVRTVVNVVQVAVTYESAYALQADGTVWSWGAGTTGGSGDPSDPRTARAPVKVPGLSGVVSLTIGGPGIVAVRGDGTVWSWQLVPGSVPSPVAGLSGIKAASGGILLRADGRVQNGTTVLPGLSGITSIGGGHAVRSDGTVWRLDGTMVPGLSGVTKVGAGTTGSIALKSDGTVWQLTAGAAPVRVPNLPKIADVGSSAGSAAFVIAA